MPRKQNKRRADGRIAVQVYLGTVDGKRKYKTVYGNTQKEADEAALQVKLALRKGIDVTAERDTFGDWAQRFLKTKKDVSEGQYRNYEACVDHLAPISDMQIGKIKTIDIQEIIYSLASTNPHTGNPTSKRRLNLVKSTAVQTFQLAIDNRALDYNPASSVKIPRDAPQDHRRALTKEEQRWITDTPHRAQRAAMIMMYAGLRRGEVIPLRWGDVNLKERTIKVDKSVALKDGKLQVKPFTKTEAGMRTIYIPDRLVEFLTVQREKDVSDCPWDAKILVDTMLVCPSASGEIMSATAWRRMWESYMCDLNIKYGTQLGVKNKFDPKNKVMTIPPITPHWLRHTYATLLYLSGVDVLTAKELMGHSDIKTTLGIYTHLDAQYKNKNTSKLNAFLNGESDGYASQMQVRTLNK